MYTFSKVWHICFDFRLSIDDDYMRNSMFLNFTDKWCNSSPSRSAACSFNISTSGLFHFHLILVDTKPCRMRHVMDLFPAYNVKPLRGFHSKFGMDIKNYLFLVSGEDEIVDIYVRRKLEG